MTSRSRPRGAPDGGTSRRSWPRPASRRTWPSRPIPRSPAGEGTLRTEQGLAALRAVSADCLSPAGQLQIATALEVTGALEARLHELRRQLTNAARHLTGAKVLAARLYEAGKTHARSPAPDHGYYAQVKERCNGKRAALSEARKILRQACHILAELGDDALAAA